MQHRLKRLVKAAPSGDRPGKGARQRAGHAVCRDIDAIKTGLHIDGKGTTGCRLGYTAMKAMGMEIPHWGNQSNQTNKEIGEIVV